MSPSAAEPVRDPVDDVLDGFDRAWRRGERPTIESYLKEGWIERGRLLRELIHTDLEYRLRAGEAARVEEYARRFPELQSEPAAIVALCLAECRARRHLGEQATVADFIQRFPEHREWFLQSSEYAAPAATIIAPEPAQRSAALPAAIGRYRVDRLMARGGMGEVVRVIDGDFDRPLAMKVLQGRFAGNPHLVERFLREAQLTGQLQHPGIPPVQAKGRLDDGRPYFIMKLIEGRDLEALLSTRAAPREQHNYYLGVFEQICRTVAYAHARGIIHRDLKPANVMVGAFGEVQVMDWGLAKALRPGALGTAAEPPVAASSTDDAAPMLPTANPESEAGAVMGTPAYLAPEQARGAVDQVGPRSDVFGLGGILCAILTGQPPFTAATAVENHARSVKGDLAEAFARLDACGADTELIVLAKRCLAPAHADRPTDAEAVAQATATHQERVRERLRQAEVAKAAAEVRATEERRRRRWQLALAASVLVLVGVGGLAGWRTLQQQAEQERQQLLRTEQARRERERTQFAVAGALEQAREWRAEALFAQARQELEQAQRLVGADGEAELRQQIDAALVQVLMAQQLDRIRQNKALIVANKMSFQEAPAAYAAVFRQHGLDMAAGEEAALAAWVVGSPLRDEVVAALDDWLVEEPDAALRSRLGRLTARITGCAWREQVAAALTDRQRLEELLTTVPAKEMTPALLCGLCQRLERLGGDGVTWLRKASWRHPADFWVWFELGSAYAKRGSAFIRERQGAYQACVALRPDSAAAWVNLGVAFHDAKDLATALAAYREALRLEPGFAIAHNNVGKALSDSGDKTGALAAYQEAIRLQPKYAQAHANLAATYWQHLRFADGYHAYRLALSVDPPFGQAPVSDVRYKGAVAALLAAAADGSQGTSALPPAEKSACRQQALEWLRADLAVWDKLLRDNRNAAKVVQRTLQTWKVTLLLASVRGELALGDLPEAERPGWRQFWSDVDLLLAQAEKACKDLSDGAWMRK